MAAGSKQRPAPRGLVPPWEELRALVQLAVAEDLPQGDPTGALVGSVPAQALLVSREEGVLAGLPAVQLVLDEVSARLGTGRATAKLARSDGDRAGAGARLGELSGPAGTLLGSERTLLNLVGHLSGIATATARFVEAVAGTGTVVRDTRKTLPGLRAVEKYAVRCGGGQNHRMNLSEAILIKDNHAAALGGVGEALSALRANPSPLPVEVEVDDLEQLEAALSMGAGLVLLDNFSLDDITRAVARASACGTKLEASGGISLANVRAVAERGVHYVAIGAITHSAPALDVALDWTPA